MEEFKQLDETIPEDLHDYLRIQLEIFKVAFSKIEIFTMVAVALGIIAAATGGDLQTYIGSFLVAPSLAFILAMRALISQHKAESETHRLGKKQVMKLGDFRGSVMTNYIIFMCSFVLLMSHSNQNVTSEIPIWPFALVLLTALPVINFQFFQNYQESKIIRQAINAAIADGHFDKDKLAAATQKLLDNESDDGNHLTVLDAQYIEQES